MSWKLKAASCPAWVQANDNAVGYYRVDYDRGLLSALTNGNVEERLNAPERADFMGNSEALTNAGKLPAADALGLVKTFHSDPERYVVQSALAVALAPRLHLVPEDLKPNYERFLRDNFQARAHELTWVPKSGESDDVRLLRPILLRDVATFAADKELAKGARDLTEEWFKNHHAINPNMVSAVLGTSAYYGDKALFERFLAEFKKTQDRQERQIIIGAMGSFHDRAALEAGMNAVLSGEIPFIEGGFLLFAGQGSASTRELAFDFLKAHFDEIAAKRPTGGGFDFGSELPRVGASFCSSEKKQELQTFFEPRVDKFTGAPRTLSQVLESIDVCIAEKSAQEPSVAEFLRKY